jgi:hypothetical protein
MEPALFSARAQFRRRTAAVVRAPADAGVHLARLQAALMLHDGEPMQGALADLFAALPEQDSGVRLAALQLVATRLPAHLREIFEQHVQGPRLPPTTPLATRWSVIAQPSASVAARMRRGSADHSRRMAAQVVQALLEDEPRQAAGIERDFLDHCLSCQDKLAFMLASRELRRHDLAVGDRWDQVAAQLQRRGLLGHSQAHHTDIP